MRATSYGYYLEALYADGFRLVEQEEDLNPYGAGNTYTAILQNSPAAFHGPLVRFSLLPCAGGRGRSIDWRDMPEGAVPVYYRRMRSDLTMGDGGGTQQTRALAHGFGWRCEATGEEEVEELE